MLELVAYYKYGHDQLNMKWRERKDGDPLPKPEIDVPVKVPTTDQPADALAALRAKFGKKP